LSQVVGITGGDGLLGWHSTAFLKTLPEVRVLLATRATFANNQLLNEFVDQCDVIFHFAGINRGEEEEVALTNITITATLIASLEDMHKTPHVLFSSSTHIRRNTPYGQSKRKCSELLDAWAKRSGGKLTKVVLPNVFGERGKPFYNSVVSTFCHQITHHETPLVHQDAQLEQIHTQVVARAFWEMVQTQKTGEIWLPGTVITVRGLLERIQAFHDLYSNHIIPDVRNTFDRDLFNTYRSYFNPTEYPRVLTLHSDARGTLFESVKTYNGGQTFLSTTKPGITRGNHYHTRKIERFLVVTGEAEIRLRRVGDTEIQVFRVSGNTPSYVDIPTLHTHNITNVGATELVTLFWTNEFFDANASDTTMELV
jgi:UDP-2-acetamido-2,6-beta-L-arabino-hexul-4-ose reductase